MRTILARASVVVEYKTDAPAFLLGSLSQQRGGKILARRRMEVCKTIGEYLEIKFVHKGEPLDSRRKSKRNRIYMDWRVTRTDFLARVRQHFADRLKLDPSEITVQMGGEPIPFFYEEIKPITERTLKR